MGSYRLVVDPNATSSAAVQGVIDELLARPGAETYLARAYNRTLYVTDNGNSTSLSSSNRKTIADLGVNLNGFSQENGEKKVIYINFGNPSHKPGLKILVHEILHFKTSKIGQETLHSPVFYKILSEVLRALGLTVSPALDLNNVDIAEAEFPSGFDPAHPLTYTN